MSRPWGEHMTCHTPKVMKPANQALKLPNYESECFLFTYFQGFFQCLEADDIATQNASFPFPDNSILLRYFHFFWIIRHISRSRWWCSWVSQEVIGLLSTDFGGSKWIQTILKDALFFSSCISSSSKRICKSTRTETTESLITYWSQITKT